MPGVGWVPLCLNMGGSERPKKLRLRATSAPPSAAYCLELEKGADAVDAFVEEQGLPSIRSVRRDEDKTNAILQRFVTHLRAAGDSRSYHLAKHGLLAMQHRFPLLKGRLAPAWSFLTEWKHATPPTQPRLPLPEDLLISMTVLARLWALEAPPSTALLWLALAVALEVSFYALLRPIEILTMRVSQVALPGEGMIGKNAHAVVSIENAKNWRHLGGSQFSVVRSSAATFWLAWLVGRLPEGSLLWPGSPQAARRMFKQLLRALGISLPFTLACLRPGGATHFFLQDTEVGRLKLWGRWTSEKTLVRYLQEATAMLVKTKLSRDSQVLLKLLPTAGAFLRSPPAADCDLLG